METGTSTENATQPIRADNDISGSHWHYRVYGLWLCSNIPLPELPRARFSASSVEFRYYSDDSGTVRPVPGRMLTRHETNVGSDLTVYEIDGGYLLRWEDLCDFALTEEGTVIECRPMPSISMQWILSILYGTVLSFSLHMRGVGNLHASAISAPAGAIGFLAEPGTGKSTLAARFLVGGYPMVTDDVLAVREEPTQGFVAQSGFPFTSLSKASMKGILGSTDAPAAGFLNGNKYRLWLDGEWAGFSTENRPLAALVLIHRAEPGSNISMTRVEPIEATRALVQNSVCMPFLPADAVRAHLAFASRLSTHVPVWSLSYPGEFDNAGEVMSTILKVIQNDAPSGD